MTDYGASRKLHQAIAIGYTRNHKCPQVWAAWDELRELHARLWNCGAFEGEAWQIIGVEMGSIRKMRALSTITGRPWAYWASLVAGSEAVPAAEGWFLNGQWLKDYPDQATRAASLLVV